MTHLSQIYIQSSILGLDNKNQTPEVDNFSAAVSVIFMAQFYISLLGDDKSNDNPMINF